MEKQDDVIVAEYTYKPTITSLLGQCIAIPIVALPFVIIAFAIVTLFTAKFLEFDTIFNMGKICYFIIVGIYIGWNIVAYILHTSGNIKQRIALSDEYLYMPKSKISQLEVKIPIKELTLTQTVKEDSSASPHGKFPLYRVTYTLKKQDDSLIQFIVGWLEDEEYTEDKIMSFIADKQNLQIRTRTEEKEAREAAQSAVNTAALIKPNVRGSIFMERTFKEKAIDFITDLIPSKVLGLIIITLFYLLCSFGVKSLLGISHIHFFAGAVVTVLCIIHIVWACFVLYRLVHKQQIEEGALVILLGAGLSIFIILFLSLFFIYLPAKFIKEKFYPVLLSLQAVAFLTALISLIIYYYHNNAPLSGIIFVSAELLAVEAVYLWQFRERS